MATLRVSIDSIGTEHDLMFRIDSLNVAILQPLQALSRNTSQGTDLYWVF